MNSEKASDWYTARRFNERVYGFKTLVDPDTGHIFEALSSGRMPMRSSTSSASPYATT